MSKAQTTTRTLGALSTSTFAQREARCDVLRPADGTLEAFDFISIHSKHLHPSRSRTDCSHQNFYVYNCRLQVCRCRLQSTNVFTLNFGIWAFRQAAACPPLRRRLSHHPNPDLTGDQLQRLAVHDVLVSIGKPKSTSISTSTT